jgi:hypothetical protein
MEHKGVYVVLEFRGPALVIFDNDDVLSLGGESFRKVGTYGPGPNNDYSHIRRILGCTKCPG